MASDTQVKTILVRAAGHSNRHVEGNATVAVVPGMFTEYVTSQQTLRPYAGANNAADIPRMVALENDVVPAGSQQGLTIDQTYAIGARVYAYKAERGDVVNALVPAAAAAIVFGDLLQSNGDGTLIIRSTGTPIARAMQAVNNSGGGTRARILVEVI